MTTSGRNSRKVFFKSLPKERESDWDATFANVPARMIGTPSTVSKTSPFSW